MSLDGKLIFVAGATGLVGSNVVNEILERHPGARLRGGFYSHTPPFIRNERIEYVYADLTSPEECRMAVQGCDCAIMAATANAGGAATAVTYPWGRVTDTLVMNARLLEAFFLEHVRRVVCLGSITAYQEYAGPICEDALDLNQDPHPAYFGIGWVVRFIEKLCQFWHDRAGMETLVVRAANVFGPYARFDPSTSNFIPALIRRAVDRADPFEVWGSPDVTRDVIFSKDFAEAVVLLLGREEIKHDVFNVGSGTPTTVADAVSWALKHAGHQPGQITYLPGKPVTNRFRALDCSKVQRALGWQPRCTVEEGIRATSEWWVQNRHWWKK